MENSLWITCHWWKFSTHYSLSSPLLLTHLLSDITGPLLSSPLLLPQCHCPSLTVQILFPGAKHQPVSNQILYAHFQTQRAPHNWVDSPSSAWTRPSTFLRNNTRFLSQLSLPLFTLTLSNILHILQVFLLTFSILKIYPGISNFLKL